MPKRSWLTTQSLFSRTLTISTWRIQSEKLTRTKTWATSQSCKTWLKQNSTLYKLRRQLKLSLHSSSSQKWKRITLLKPAKEKANSTETAYFDSWKKISPLSPTTKSFHNCRTGSIRRWQCIGMRWKTYEMNCTISFAIPHMMTTRKRSWRTIDRQLKTASLQWSFTSTAWGSKRWKNWLNCTILGSRWWRLPSLSHRASTSSLWSGELSTSTRLRFSTTSLMRLVRMPIISCRISTSTAAWLKKSAKTFFKSVWNWPGSGSMRTWQVVLPG